MTTTEDNKDQEARELRDEIARAIQGSSVHVYRSGVVQSTILSRYDSLRLADAVLPIVTQREAALRQRIADYLPTHAGGDETDPWQAGHNYAMREAARLIQERHDTL